MEYATLTAIFLCSLSALILHNKNKKDKEKDDK